MSRSGFGSRSGARGADQLNEIHSTASLRGKSKDIGADETASLFSYGPRASPSKNAKSILYRMH